MSATRFSAGQAVAAHDIAWSDARRALSVIGFIPLTQIAAGEHWVRGPRHVILHVDSPVPAEAVCEETMLAGARYVHFFTPDGETLIASVD